jgi:hypothetical protein
VSSTTSKEEEQQVLRAVETIDALASLFEVPLVRNTTTTTTSNCHNSHNEQSPVCVREQLGNAVGVTEHYHPNKPQHPQQPQHSTTNNNNNNNNNNRRSIFGPSSTTSTTTTTTTTSSTSFLPSIAVPPSFSGFGIFLWEGLGGSSSSSAGKNNQNNNNNNSTTGTTNPPSTVDPNNHKNDFRLLTANDRANSMPARLPRKSSLKRISSIHSTTSNNSGTPDTTTSSANNNHKSPAVKRTVSFGKLETREYSIALSDHPSCSYGPPISLGWDFCDKESMTLDDYEYTRTPYRRKNMHDMILSYNVRRYLLLKRAGYTPEELEAAMNEVDRVKRERLVTDLLLPASHIDETMEDVIRRIKNIFGPN